MLNLYFGRDNLNKDQFLFDTIENQLEALPKSTYRKIFLLVPDQFTLQAERNAFACLKTDGFMDLEILSMTRLASRVLEEEGGAGHRVHIGKYGRHMLLSRILSRMGPELEVFRGLENTSSFIEMANNFISQMKQFDMTPEALSVIMEDLPEDSFLRRKLGDIHKIYTLYNEELKGKYTDSEDYLDLCISKIKESSLVKGGLFWISGFHSFMPKSLRIIEGLLEKSRGVNILLTGSSAADAVREGDLFKITGQVMHIFGKMAEEKGIPWNKVPIPETYEIRDRAKAISHVEKELFAWPYKSFATPQSADADSSPKIRLCQAGTFYGEAETAAAAIVSLVRDKGFRYREIGVICNDMTDRGPILKRIFDSWEIPSFMDQTRKILHHPAVSYILALFDTLADGWTYDNLFRMVKTGFTPLSQEEGDRLGNYALQYRIRGNGWKKDFRYGKTELGEDGLKEINELRERLAAPLGEFDKEFKAQRTVRGKTEALYLYLRDQVRMPEALKALMEKLEDNQQPELAEETAQIWNVLIDLMDQLTEILGDDRISSEAYGELLRTGLDAAEIGILPSTSDQLTIGTMQRTRTGQLRALFVVGANDGILPASQSSEDLLNEDEKKLLEDRGTHLCKNDSLRFMEEKLALYKAFSAPTDFLWVGYSCSDLEGKEAKPSMIFDKLRKIFPDVIPEKDILNHPDDLCRIGAPESSLLHLAAALRQSHATGEPLSEEWMAAWNWHKEHQPEKLAPLTEGLSFRGRRESLSGDLAEALYKGGADSLSVSPSRLEKFSRCPFSHLILYGLKPQELRVFEASGREVGDLYHECLMTLSKELSLPGVDITDPESPWMTLSQEGCKERVGKILRELASEYKEGMFLSGKEEEYRLKRMEDVCSKVAWNLVHQIRQGEIKKLFLEHPFGFGSFGFPSVDIPVGDKVVSLRGKIDRVDLLPGNYVKIIDYKSGQEAFNLEEVKGGWRLQLMLYLRAAMDGLEKEQKSKEEPIGPAGVFYFSVKEPMVDKSDDAEDPTKEDMEKEVRKNFKLDGVLLDSPGVIHSIAGDFSGYSPILPIQKNKDGEVKGTKRSEKVLLSDQEFRELQETVDEITKDLVHQLMGGVIRPRPKQTKAGNACRFCQYKSICLFDTAFSGCRYERI
ncbi:MAG: hypothetical protein E7224_03580 [Clostridiales bacterium]|nr:hypothetical protein [Clostridiales bacterium]